MQVDKKNLEKSQVEISVSLSVEEFTPFIEKGAKKLTEKIKIEGFRPGKAPLEVLKAKVGEMSILEEAAQLAVEKTVDEIIEKNTLGLKPVGSPSVNVTKLAPDNPFEFKVVLSLLPDVALGKYKELGLKKDEVKIDAEKIEKTLKDLAEMRAVESLVEREIEDGDKVTVDINMLLSKVAIENGQHKELAIIVGKDYLVPGFDKKLIGAKAGDERKFDLVYPDNHHQKELAGKKVSFEVRIKGVYNREIPEVNDELAKNMHFKDLKDLRDALEENIKQEKERESELKSESEMISKIIDDTKISELPEILIQSEARNIMSELEQSVIRQGGKFDDYLSHLKKTKEELMLDMLPNAVKRVKSALVIREIAIVEKIDVSEEEIEEKISELKEKYKGNAEVLKMVAEAGYKSYLRNILNNEKVLAKLKDWNYAATSTKQKS